MGRKNPDWPVSQFAARLRFWRDERQYTQQQLADLAGCHKITIAKLEGGSQEPIWPLVLQLARALACEPNDFLGEGELPRRRRRKKVPRGEKNADELYLRLEGHP